MKPFIEPTKGQTPPTWADIDWHAVEMNVGRLQERIYRATQDGDWMRVKSLQKLLARATSNGRGSKVQGLSRMKGNFRVRF